MKSIFKFAVLGAIVLTSCTKDEIVNQSTNLAVSFDTYVAKATKAAPITGTSFVAGSTMGVYAYNTEAADWSGTNIDAIVKKPLINEKVTKEDSKWTYTNTAYYVKNEKISFLAYAPYMESVQFADGKLEHQVSTALSDQKDLMIAVPVTNKTWDGNTATTPEKITFAFKHALSQVKFKAKLKEAYTDYTIKVNSITLKAIQNIGKVSLTASDINWSDLSGSQNYTMTFATNTINNTAATELTAEGGNGDVFMLLPQTLSNVTFTFNITATPTTEAANAGKVEKTRNFDVIVSSGTWAASNIYAYTATLTMDFDAPAIEFGEPTITEWSGETGTEINNDPTPAPEG
ncbi:fimbrillin family protein [uncultured Parabacteroides sp.]|uniref:fimbrillin family protein n=1 Tax=uncultured Parabacteroides sp. TaxID=512312 RepID=UPI0025EAC1E4|nr:fimbrillin family protein [uncultured Parabacteroides sp.]